MNKFLLFFLLITLSACKEKKDNTELPCKYYFYENTDEFENRTLYESKHVSLKDNDNKTYGKILFSSLDLKLYYVEIELIKSLCSEQNTKIIFLYTDNSTTEYFVKNEPNCRGHLLIERPFISEFKNKKLKGFRIKTYGDYIDFYINEDSQNDLQKTADCYFEISNKYKK